MPGVCAGPGTGFAFLRPSRCRWGRPASAQPEDRFPASLRRVPRASRAVSWTARSGHQEGTPRGGTWSSSSLGSRQALISCSVSCERAPFFQGARSFSWERSGLEGWLEGGRTVHPSSLPRSRHTPWAGRGSGSSALGPGHRGDPQNCSAGCHWGRGGSEGKSLASEPEF